MSYAFQQCKNFENRLRLDKVTESFKVGTFLRHSVEYPLIDWFDWLTSGCREAGEATCFVVVVVIFNHMWSISIEFHPLTSHSLLVIITSPWQRVVWRHTVSLVVLYLNMLVQLMFRTHLHCPSTFLFTSWRSIQQQTEYRTVSWPAHATGGLQWRSQKLCVGEAPSGVGSGEVCPLPSRLGALGSVVSSKVPAANAFSAYSRPYSDAEPIDPVLIL